MDTLLRQTIAAVEQEHAAKRSRLLLSPMLMRSVSGRSAATNRLRPTAPAGA